MAKSKPTTDTTETSTAIKTDASKPDAPPAGDPPATTSAETTPPKEDSKAKPKGGKGYICVDPVRYNGKDHPPGNHIELTEAEAAPLLKLQAIEAA